MSFPSMDRISRRHFLQTTATTAGTFSLAGALAACGGTSSSPAKGTATITYWDSFVTQGPWVDNEIQLFQKANPGIKIKKTTQAAGNYDNLFSLALRSKSVPDVGNIPSTPTLYEQVNKGWWLSLDKWATTEWKAKFPTNALHEGSNVFNGKLYSAPISGLVMPFQLYINNSVFRSAGLVDSSGQIMIPRTWDDVTHAAEAITKKGGGSVYGLGFGNGSFNLLNWWLFVFIIGAGCPGGGGDLDLRVGKYTFASNRNYADWLQLWKSWKDKGYFYPNAISISDEVSRAYFERGKFGMTIGGVWNQSEWKQHGFTDYSLTTLITPEQTPTSYFPTRPGGASFAVSANTKHPDEAWAWFDWLHSIEAGKRWVQMGEDLSIFPQNNDPKNNAFPPYSQYLATAKYAIPGPDPTLRNSETGFVTPQPVKPAMADIMAGYYTNQIKDLTGALSQLQQQSQTAFEAAIAQAKQQGHKVSIDDYIFPDWDVTKAYYTKPR